MEPIDLLAIERAVRETEAEGLEAYERGLADAPILYRPTGVVEKAQDSEGRTTFVASEESEDRFGDVVTARGWELRNYRKNPVVLFGHDHSIPAIGAVRNIGTEGRRLMATVEFDMDDPFAAMLAQKFRGGFMRAVSVGFRPLAFERRESGGEFVGFKFTSQELLELSAVPVPAHPAALKKAYGGDRFTMVVPKEFNLVAERQTATASTFTHSSSDMSSTIGYVPPVGTTFRSGDGAWVLRVNGPLLAQAPETEEDGTVDARTDEERLDDLEAKVDRLLGLLTPPVEEEQVEGAETPSESTDDSEDGDEAATLPDGVAEQLQALADAVASANVEGDEQEGDADDD